MDGIHEILEAIYSSSQGDVLATIIRVEGSAYRKEGTSMLFRNDGSQVGLLSAGCLEVDLACRIEETKNQRTTQTVVYDMREEEDLSWGQGAGCNGVISVLLEPIDACLRDHLCKLKFHLEEGKRVTMLKKITENYNVSDYLFVTDDGNLFGKWHGGISVQVKNLLTEIHQTTRKSGLRFLTELSSQVYLHTFEPKPRLIVFGAGADAIPLVRLAAQVGFSVIVSDWRSALCNERCFPDAHKRIVGHPSDVLSALPLSNLDSVIILTHHFQKDKELLHQLNGKNLLYLGVLGSSSRTRRLLEGKAIPSDVNSPVGLAIGAEGPEEIAVSIVAELIQRQRTKRSAKVVCH
ncbi:XdhC family protein [Neobacillus jeddahensis]|uniref:XdhC family protein n=1 Tax=Neobacillus jeddahensis TaxID=1461580 RepID=UPI0005909DD3|nr:XdhC family protein [Neobacillus jeddahensis]